MIILVDGFANCEILQRKVQQQFSSIRVIVPVDEGLAALLVAVLFGHSPLVITSRVTRKTYGVIVDDPFYLFLEYLSYDTLVVIKLG
jgi:hypothetical protein